MTRTDNRSWTTLTQAMDQHRAEVAEWSLHQSRFEFAPPRHFLLPAILLLVSEMPGYGYSLVKDLQDLRFGQVERPAVYRALRQLETDGLVTTWDEPARAGQARKVYAITEYGSRMLRAWMSVVKDERDCLDRVLQRYQATGTTDAALAQVEGAWLSALGPAFSPVSSTSPSARRRRPAAPVSESARPAGGSVTTVKPVRSDGENESIDGEPGVRRRFRVVPERSIVLIEARSTVGPIRFAATGLTGAISVELRDGAISTHSCPDATLLIPVNELRSGNALYDAELVRRVEGRRFPQVRLDLRACEPIGRRDRYRLSGDVTFHGITRPLQGTVDVTMLSERRLVVAGDHALDARDFHLSSPTVLMLRIYPDVRVSLNVEAELED